MPLRSALVHHRPACGLAAVIALAALLGAPARAQNTQRFTARLTSDTLTVGTYAYSTNDRLANIAPLAHYLGERLQREVRVVSLPDPPALAAAVREGRVDVAVMNTFGYLLLTADAAPAGQPVATFRIRAGERSNYRSGIVMRRDALHSLDELRDRAGTLSIALVAPGSTTGNLVPRLALAARGIPELERSFRRVTYAGTRAGALAAVRAGDADVAALATEEFERVVAADSTVARELRVLWQSDDILLGPVVVRSALPPALRTELARAIVGLERAAPDAFAALRGGWTEARQADALVAASDRTYDAVRRMFGDSRAAATLIERFAR
jgi:phosphate/phosphite/phosphonate ABC transporter binding protein